ncbi:MAG: FAD-dependent oxidoreductase [Luteolibacter sp.]
MPLFKNIRHLALAALATTALADEPRGLIYYRPVERAAPKTLEFDVAVYGGTPGGFATALQAARVGKNVVLVSFDPYVGGLTSAGLTATDVGRKTAIGGMAMEFYERVGKLRDFSPSKAESTFRAMLDEAKVTVLTERPLESVEMDGTKITSITLETGEIIKAAIFADSTYEGDLFAAANVSYHVGREPAATYGESLGGQWQTVEWESVYQFCDLPISPFKIADDPDSGLLPGISPHPHGKPGDGDHRVQAYNFRMFLSNKDGKVAFPKPDGYDPGRYALLARFMNFDADITWTLNYTTRPMHDGPVQMRNGDSNNAGSFSSNNVNGSNFWPDGTFEPINFAELPPPRRGLRMPLKELYQMREKIFQDHVTYQQGYMYFMANDPQVPKDLQERVNQFGLDPNEFPNTGHWPHSIYVREGRRMISDYVMTQANCERKRVAEDSIGLASYPMDSHPCQRVVVERDGVTTVRNEGAFGDSSRGPYPVSYRSIVPKKSECTNLLVPVCLSSSHVAFGSIRMEPVYMILGQSAGTAAAIAIDDQVAIQDVDYPKLSAKLLQLGQILTYPQPNPN